MIDVPGSDHAYLPAALSEYLTSLETAALAESCDGRGVPRNGGVFGDDVVAAAMIDGFDYHSDVVAIKGDSYRL